MKTVEQEIQIANRDKRIAEKDAQLLKLTHSWEDRAGFITRTTEALRACVLEINQMHTEYQPGCLGGCPAAEALDEAKALIKTAEDFYHVERKSLKVSR